MSTPLLTSLFERVPVCRVCITLELHVYKNEINWVVIKFDKK